MSNKSPVLSRLLVVAMTACSIPLVMGGCSAAPEEMDEGVQEVDSEEPTGTRDDEVGSGTVANAVSNSCATSSVKGLSLQIIQEGRCLSPNAYVKVPDLKNISFGPNVFPYLEKPARDNLVAALNANPGKSLSVNSMLRTVAQQYLLYKWGQAGKCGIGLAATPGNSNHETGLAMDVNEYSAWKSILSAKGFKWFGNSDKVHFDYVGAGAKSYKGIDVLAFQKLWNRNNPNDKISADGDWGPQTEARMKKAPAAGFAKGAECNAAFTDDEIDTGDATEPTPPPEEEAAPMCASGLAHPICEAGELLDPTCDPCAEDICAIDSYCCTTEWDAVCLEQVSSVCGKSCAASDDSAEAGDDHEGHAH
jgi:hypothetical protein